MIFIPGNQMIFRPKDEVLSMTAQTLLFFFHEIGHSMAIGTKITTGNMIFSGRLLLVDYPCVTSNAFFPGIDMGLMGKAGGIFNDSGFLFCVIGIGVTEGALGIIFVMTGIAGFHGR
jgi:hypothetical protein